VKTRLVFMPFYDRDTTKPLDVSKESMVCHSGRFYSFAQFTVYTVEVAPARGEPSPSVFGFSGGLDEQPLTENYQDRRPTWLAPKIGAIRQHTVVKRVPGQIQLGQQGCFQPITTG